LIANINSILHYKFIMDGGIVIVIIVGTGIGFFVISRLVERGAIKLAKKIHQRSFIKTTNTINFKNNSDFKNDDCIICLTDYSENNKYSELYCGHRYHTKCIKKWMNYREICPLCNTKLIKKNKQINSRILK